MADRFVVTLAPSAGATQQDLLEQFANNNGRVYASYRFAFRGFAASLTPAGLTALGQSSSVARIDAETVQCLDSTAVESRASARAVAPWGLDRIDQQALPLDGTYRSATNGAGVYVYVVDSGIRRSHEDFDGPILSGAGLVPGSSGTDDCDGHGTAVSGIVAGTRYGVAPAAAIVPVRVFDCTGASTASVVLSGLDWVAQHIAAERAGNPALPAVANLSFAGPGSVLNAAVAGLIDQGVAVVAAAGNVEPDPATGDFPDPDDACDQTPAGVRRAITVGAVTHRDTRAAFSNAGNCVDLFAPGERVPTLSWRSDSGILMASGTSIAAPHVAGVAAQYLADNPTAAPNDVAERIERRAARGMLTDVRGSANLLVNAE